MMTVKEKKTPIHKKKKEIPREYLEVAAYYRWQARGCPQGDPLTDWIEAERLLSSHKVWDIFKKWGWISKKAALV